MGSGKVIASACPGRGLSKYSSGMVANPILGNLLFELASILLTRGVTSAEFNEISKRAFIKAAATRSTFRNGRVNQSRVSVLTGLRRGEVRRLLRSSESKRLHEPPLESVISGWCEDRRFTNPTGAPKRLKITGSRTSFSSLVKNYAADLPPQALLQELSALGVTRQSGRFVEVKSLRPLRRRRNFVSMAALMPVLVDGLRLAGVSNSRAGSSSMRRLVVPARSLLDLEMIRARCTSSVETMLHGLKGSLFAGRHNPSDQRRTTHSYSVTVLLVENRSR